MYLAIIVVFAAIGISLILAEIFLLPGTTLVGIIGVAFMAAASWVAFSQFGTRAGWITTFIMLALLIPAIYAFIKVGVMDKTSLKAEIDGTVEAKENFASVGQRGVATSRLAPIGNANFDGKTVEVKSVEGMVDAGTAIEVISVDKQEILVRTIA